MDLISKVGAAVIHRNMIGHVDIPYMDTCVESGENKPLEVIKSLLTTPTDMGVVFNQYGKTTRLESICRENDLLIFKGSFNPPHKAHIKMMEACVEELGVQGYFAISLETFGKGFGTPEDILHRISMINDLGYSVVINKTPLFRDFVDLFNNRMNKEAKLHFVMGEDTAIRFVQVAPDDINHCPTKIVDGEVHKQDCIYHVFKRTEDPLDLPSKFKVYQFNVPSSSTFVREHLNFEYLDDKTIKYITKNKLYQSEK
jgi:nicotinic acid mononucleotide adenylyltransferase